MTITTRFGKKLKIPSTFQIKHQLLLFWLKDQLEKEAAEDEAAERVTCGNKASTAEDPILPTRGPLTATKTAVPLPAERLEFTPPL